LSSPPPLSLSLVWDKGKFFADTHAIISGCAALVFADFGHATLITARAVPASLDRALRRASGSMGRPSNAESQMRKQLQLLEKAGPQNS